MHAFYFGTVDIDTKKKGKIFHAAGSHPGVKKTGQFFSESARAVAGAGSCNDLPFQNQTNQSKIDVIKNSTFIESESEDEILCEMELR